LNEIYLQINIRIKSFLFAGDLVLLASSEQGLYHAFDRLKVLCDQTGMKICQ